MAQHTTTLDNLYQAPEAELVDANAKSEAFFVVSTKKLYIMNVATVGLYSVYWFYKHYAQIRRVGGESVLPVMRAIFQIFFAFNLFKRIHTAADNKNIQMGWSYQSLAVAFIVLTLIFNMSDSISPVVGALSLVIIPMITYIIAQVQATANEVQNDAQGVTNDRITVFNILWCVLGFMLWSSLLLGSAMALGFIQL